MAKRLEWTDEHQSTNGKFVINSITHVASGRVEWFLSEGPLDRAPAPCDSLEEAKALAQAIANGPKALAAFDAPRTAVRLEQREARQAERKRAAWSPLLDDPEFIAAMRERLAAEAG